MKKNKIILLISIIFALIVLILYLILEPKKDKKIYYYDNIDFKRKELLAVAYLKNEIELSNKYNDIIKTIKIYNLSGEELVLLIPRYNEISFNIYDNEDNLIINYDYPIIIRYNKEEIKIKYKYKEKEYDFNYQNHDKHILDITKN